jgi:hypothetical protein
MPLGPENYAMNWSGYNLLAATPVVSEALEKLGLKDGPYMALFLKEVNDVAIDKRQLRLPIIVACAMSKHIRIIFPMSNSVSCLVDDVFESLFRRQFQIAPKVYKEFVVGSKGILYAKDLTFEEEMSVLQYATFTMTTDVKICGMALKRMLPCAFVAQDENSKPEIILSNHEDMADGRIGRMAAPVFGRLVLELKDLRRWQPGMPSAPAYSQFEPPCKPNFDPV